MPSGWLLRGVGWICLSRGAPWSRRAARRRCSLPVSTCRRVRVKVDGPWLVTMHNVSHQGLGLISEQSFPPGTILKVDLPSLNRRHLAPKLIRVTHSAPHPGGEGWVLGGVFLRRLSEEELQVLL